MRLAIGQPGEKIEQFPPEEKKPLQHFSPGRTGTGQKHGTGQNPTRKKMTPDFPGRSFPGGLRLPWPHFYALVTWEQRSRMFPARGSQNSVALLSLNPTSIGPLRRISRQRMRALGPKAKALFRQKKMTGRSESDSLFPHYVCFFLFSRILKFALFWGIPRRFGCRTQRMVPQGKKIVKIHMKRIARRKIILNETTGLHSGSN